MAFGRIWLHIFGDSLRAHIHLALIEPLVSSRRPIHLSLSSVVMDHGHSGGSMPMPDMPDMKMCSVRSSCPLPGSTAERSWNR